MKKNLSYLVGAVMLANCLVFNPLTYGEDRGISRYIKRAEEGISRVGRSLKRFHNKLRDYEEDSTPEQRRKERERAGKIAGTIMENIYGIPGISKAIEKMNEELDEDGYWERQRQRAREYKRRNRSKW